MVGQKTLLQLNNASFKYPAGDYLFERIKLSVQTGDKIALVGVNGSGKSTIFKILAEQIPLEEGSIKCHQPAYYLPQIDITLHSKNLKLFDYLEKQYENWWEILEEVETRFNTKLDPEMEVNHLSGGELMKINLAIALKHHSEILLLDEPTNHLDIKSVQTLISFLQKAPFAYVIISHDIFFLDQVVTTIWELENKNIKTYGGNYTFYKEQKALHLRGLEKKVELAKDKLERANELAQKEAEKRARKANTAKLAFIKGAMTAREYHGGADAASASLGANKKMLHRLKSDAEEQLEENTTEQRKLAFIGMKNTTGNTGRTIFSVEKGTLKVKNTTILKDINLKIIYGDRLVIAGENGSGKTAFVKSVVGKTPETKLEGEIFRNPDIKITYVDQTYSLIQPQLSLIENIMAYDKTVPEFKAKEQLGKFQFKAEAEMARQAHLLSGGEMARLMLAMVSSYPIDVLILDEPTNNVDVETISVLEKALNTFVGALIVISHNIEFLKNINIKTAYIIKDKKLKLMQSTPANKDRFYKELVG